MARVGPKPLLLEHPRGGCLQSWLHQPTASGVFVVTIHLVRLVYCCSKDVADLVGDQSRNRT